VADLKNLKLYKGARLPFKWIPDNNHTLNLHSPPCGALFFDSEAWWNAWHMHCTYHTWSFLCLIIAECCKYSWWFAPVSHHVSCGDDDTFWSTFAIHQMCMWGVRFFPIWNSWLYGSLRESQMQHFHLQIMISWLCRPTLWTLKWPLSSMQLRELLFSLQSNWGTLYFFFRTYMSLYQILSCTVVKALLFWMKLYLCAELNKSLNMLINHSLLLYWRPRKLISEFCIHLQEIWKPHYWIH